ncbi:MAG: hypothetical protein LBJ46_04425 [Planctomycetota bacterium]|jgi:hypothetical protein|nr:hypothetical protein [Planctomycetota bacterium]
MTRFLHAAAAVILLVLSLPSAARGAEWTRVFSLRLDDVEALDARDGELAAFLGGIGVDAGSSPPVRSLVGPLLKNPYLTALAPDAWIEGALLVPDRPGRPAWVWIFPVDDQDDYRAVLERQGLVNLENMDDGLLLGESVRDGAVSYWHLEWFSGNIAAFGSDRDAVRAAREIHESAGEARGSLADRRDRTFSPDLSVRFSPRLLAAWQDREPGVYWWRTQVERLAGELVGFLAPAPSRAGLVRSLADDLAAAPLAWEGVELSLWLGRSAVEWRLDLFGGAGGQPAKSALSLSRRLPEGIAQGFAASLSRESMAELGDLAGRLVVGGAGGAVSTATREEARVLLALLTAAGPNQAAVGWDTVPARNPRLGSARVMAVEWDSSAPAVQAWRRFETETLANAAVRQTLGQLGWNVTVGAADPESGARSIRIDPAAGGSPYLNLLVAARAAADLTVFAWAENVDDPELRAERAARLSALVERMLLGDPEGQAGVREAFTLMGRDGADFLAVLYPVAFMKMALSENADWRRMAADGPEPESTRLAREMHEYVDAGPPWSAVGERIEGGWRVNGAVAWESLLAFAAALGLTDYLW